MVEKLNVEALRNKLEEIIKNRSNISVIGEKGRETALQYFNCFNYANLLDSFLNRKISKNSINTRDAAI